MVHHTSWLAGRFCPSKIKVLTSRWFWPGFSFFEFFGENMEDNGLAIFFTEFLCNDVYGKIANPLSSKIEIERRQTKK